MQTSGPKDCGGKARSEREATMNWIDKLTRRGGLLQNPLRRATSESLEERSTDRRLRAGAFYWVIPTFNPDAELWVNERMPARFVGYVDGALTWNFLGKDGVSDWPVG
jgi:hypothetical protein